MENLDENIYKMFLRLPFPGRDWVLFKGETYVATINYEATVKAKKPMVDLAYCLTYDATLKTVQWDKNKFKASHLSCNPNW